MADEFSASLDISQLRNLVRQYIDNHMHKTALFWADKVYTLSKHNRQDCLWLAHTYFLNKQFSRAAQLLKSNDLISKNSAARYLAAKCLYEEKDYKGALDILESVNIDKSESKTNTFNSSLEPHCGSNDGGINNSSLSGSMTEDPPVFIIHGSNRKLDSAIFLLRGKIHDNFENKILAVKCYKEALQLDVYCYEAFECLVLHNVMNSSEEIQLLNGLPLAQQCSQEESNLIKTVYSCKIAKYSKPIIEKLPKYLETLEDNQDFIVDAAVRYFNSCHYKDAFKLVSKVYKIDPLHEMCLPLYISCLVEFKMKNELYYTASKLVNTYPNMAVSWYAVGAYYLIIKSNEQARKFFSKATVLDVNFGPAWLGFAHSYASEGERDQAISAYYNASKFMPGSHLPYLYLGLEYSQSHNIKLAGKFLKEALAISPNDFHIQMELGSLLYQNSEYSQAEVYFLESLKMILSIDSDTSSEILEPLYNNLGHVARKLKKYDKAISYHQKALLLQPRSSSNYASIGLCYFLKRDFESSWKNCHKALSLKKHDTFTIQLLEQVLDCYSHLGDQLDISVNSNECKEDTKLSISLSCTSNNTTSLSEVIETSTVEMSDSSRIITPDSSMMSLDVSSISN